MTSEFAAKVEQVLRKTGGLANAALAAAFGWAAIRLVVAALDHLKSAGGIPSLDVATLANLATSPEASAIAGDFALAWLCAVAAAGCGFMALLGLRWSFHAGLRAVSSLRG